MLQHVVELRGSSAILLSRIEVREAPRTPLQTSCLMSYLALPIAASDSRCLRQRCVAPLAVYGRTGMYYIPGTTLPTRAHTLHSSRCIPCTYGKRERSLCRTLAVRRALVLRSHLNPTATKALMYE